MAGAAGSELSRGGMQTKIEAGNIATRGGTHMVIASGRISASACGESVRSQCRSSASSTIDGGNFGALPKPPSVVSSSRSTAATA